MLISVQEHGKNTINFFIAQNMGNKAKPRDHDPPGYFRSKKYPGYEVDFHPPKPRAAMSVANSTADVFLQKSLYIATRFI